MFRKMPNSEIRKRVVASVLSRVGAAIRGIKNKAPRIYLSSKLIPIMSRKTKYGGISLYCPSSIAVQRAKVFLSKEPETNRWIDGFDKNSIFWDIGANVGVFSLYAGLRKDLSIYSFEPLYSNYMVLMKNLQINGMLHRVNGFPLAFSESTTLSNFHIKNPIPGYSGSVFGESRDYKGNRFVAAGKQAMISFAIDDFVNWFGLKIPNYVKIDVDGIESKILKGAKHTISDRKVKSVLVELDEDRKDFQETLQFLKLHQFEIVQKSRTFEDLDSTTFNYIFERK